MGLTLACPFGPEPRRPRKSGISQTSQGHLILSPHPITALSPGKMRSMHGGQGALAGWRRCDNQQWGARHLTPPCPQKEPEHVLGAPLTAISSRCLLEPDLHFAWGHAGVAHFGILVCCVQVIVSEWIMCIIIVLPLILCESTQQITGSKGRKKCSNCFLYVLRMKSTLQRFTMLKNNPAQLI